MDTCEEAKLTHVQKERFSDQAGQSDVYEEYQTIFENINKIKILKAILSKQCFIPIIKMKPLPLVVVLMKES